MITLKGHIVLPADQRDEIVTAFDEHIRLSRAEPGNLKFELTPDADDPLIWHLEEAYVDAAALEAHKTRAEAVGWFALTKDVERHYKISEEN